MSTTPHVRILIGADALASARAAATSTSRHASDLLNGLGLVDAPVDASLPSRIAERLTTLAAIDDRPALRTALQALFSRAYVLLGRDVREIQEIVRAVRPLRDHEDRELAVDALHAAVHLPLAEPDVTDIEPLGSVLRDRARKGFSDAAGYRHSVSWAITALGDVAWLDDERGAAAGRHLTAFVESASDEYVRNAGFDDPAAAIHMVGRSHAPVALDVCLRLLTIPASEAIRRAALDATGRLGGPAVVSRLIPFLDDPALSDSAAVGIGWAMSGTGDEATVRRLALAAAADHRRHTPVYYVESMLQVGGPLARHVTSGMLPVVSSHVQESILWALDGLSLGNALHAAVHTGLMRTRPSAFEIGRQRRGAYRSGLDSCVFRTLLILYSRFVHFDGDASTYPADHPELIWRFAHALQDLLPVSAPSQSCQESASETRKPTCTVRFIANDRVYEFEVKAETTSYDLPPLRAALDRALEDAGRDERLVPLETSSFHVWPRAAVDVARSLSLSLADERSEWRARIGEARWREPWPIDTPPPAIIALDALVIPPEPGAPSLTARLEEAAARAGWAAAYAPSSSHSLQLARENGRLDVRFAPGGAWTRVTLEPDAAALSSGAFADGIRLVCEALPVSFARTCRTDGWARVQPREVSGRCEALDWVQFFPASLGHVTDTWSTKDVPGARWETLETGRLLWLGEDPLADLADLRDNAACYFSLKFRPLAPDVQAAIAARRRAIARAPEVLSSPGLAPARAATLSTQLLALGLSPGVIEDFLGWVSRSATDPDGVNKLWEWCAFYGEPAALAAVIEAFGPEALPSAPDWTALEGAIKFAAWCPPSRDRGLVLRRWLRSTHGPGLLPAAGFPWLSVLEAFERDTLHAMLTIEMVMIRHCDCDVCKGLQAEIAKDQSRR